MMAKLTVDIPDSVLGDEKAKELAAARKRIKALERKVAELQQTHERATAAIKEYREFRALVADSLGLFEDYPWE